jgi:hypothetical protein
VHNACTIVQIADIFLSQNPHLNLRVGQVKLHLEYILCKNIITSNSGAMSINTKSMSCQKGTKCFVY